MKDKDFSIEVYKNLLSAINNAGYKVLTIKEYLMQKGQDDALILLRHDVDRRPENALKMSEAESSFDISSTYYFRFKKNTFKPGIIKKIEKAGHEIGYHYEVMDKAKGDFEQAGYVFKSELAKLRSLADISTVCMHGNPLSPWDNREFWQGNSFAQFNLLGEAYLSINDLDLYYTTDTGRGWNRGRYNLKDVFPGSAVSYLPTCATTRQLINLIKTKKYKKIYLQIHPNRWSWSRFQWNLQLAEDLAANFIKLLIAHYRKGK